MMAKHMTLTHSSQINSETSYTNSTHQLECQKDPRGEPGFEPGTTRTQSEYHQAHRSGCTTRPYSHNSAMADAIRSTCEFPLIYILKLVLITVPHPLPHAGHPAGSVSYSQERPATEAFAATWLRLRMLL